MRRLLCKGATMLALMATLCLIASGQVSSTGSLAGTVTDPSGAVLAGANVVVKNTATNSETTTTTAENGTFNVPALGTGIYTVAITSQGFKQAVITDVKIDVGAPSSINVAMEVGQVGESVTIVGAGGELLQTQSATVSTTITGRQITDLPYASRNALDVVLLLPGASTPGRPRTSSVNGLPKGSLNITLDGINVQDNLLKSSDGFFTYIQPKTDAVEEVTLSTANPGAESAGEGAVQIKFATRSGTSDFHGSAYIYHRNPAFNANYYFNNRDLPADPVDGKAPRTRVLLTQPGGRVGGPIFIPGLFNEGRDRAFFFVNYEEYRLPERTLRQPTIVSPLAQSGVFQYAAASGAIQQVNLLALAAATNCGTTAAPVACTSTIDPTVGALLGQIRSSTSQG
ncbi:MAG: carboxypeptidase regulatory-like domain-containing protein, partial [Pyrinomonadaceae bacterium]